MLRRKIAAGFPGTRIALIEYNYGGAAHISGGLALADVLGILGRDDVYAAAFSPLDSAAAGNRFVHAAFRLFRAYDSAAGAFGDTSFSAISSDPAKASVTKAQVYQLTSTSAYSAGAPSVVPTHLTGLSGNAFNATLPAPSATTYVLLP